MFPQSDFFPELTKNSIKFDMSPLSETNETSRMLWLYIQAFKIDDF